MNLESFLRHKLFYFRLCLVPVEKALIIRGHKKNLFNNDKQ